MRSVSEIQQRHLMFRRAPELALSGNYRDAHDIAIQLRREGIDVRLFMSAATSQWLDELCQRRRASSCVILKPMSEGAANVSSS